MNFLPLAALAIALSGALALLDRSRRNGSRAALADREALSDVQIYRQFYATNDLDEAEVCTLWNEIAGTLQVPANKLRPSDRFWTDIGVWFITSEELDALGDLAARHATQRGVKIDIASFATVDDYIKAFAARHT
ncbi:hypothetical protein PQH03_25560 [Ralstonia insidiosa]|jgi:hypothetical protein|uniref:hypothetical protein n=1 Tax=Ralstonia TaxID=48736 RepID=UPI0010F72ACC|nr:hypothetical protein [Ralstonia insidiosa]MBX3772422.1 hypothetical protein [Ralstonia pickettii]NOZ17699.1 hypothetical protein [Betaproteobacteria bacterium]MBC9965395.1 hypothetical protein [Ralstonia insidiosa]MBX3811231.1 hypothetical protein [Ralstonia pickettii]MBX3817308.1 hypothetical protein [Ralstonia insidiosa]